MRKINGYILKIDNKTNKIIDFEKFNGTIDEIMALSDYRNKMAVPGVRYLPMPRANREPRIGNDATQELKDNMGSNSEQRDTTGKDIDSAIRMLIAMQMTVRATHQIPIPTISVEEAESSINNCIMLLFALKAMSQKYTKDEEEKKDAIGDLFKKLGLKGE